MHKFVLLPPELAEDDEQVRELAEREAEYQQVTQEYPGALEQEPEPEKQKAAQAQHPDAFQPSPPPTAADDIASMTAQEFAALIAEVQAELKTSAKQQEQTPVTEHSSPALKEALAGLDALFKRRDTLGS